MTDWTAHDEDKHGGKNQFDCPACKPLIDNATRLQNAKLRKVYGKVSRKSRAEGAANRRHAGQLFLQAYKEHHQAITQQEGDSK